MLAVSESGDWRGWVMFFLRGVAVAIYEEFRFAFIRRAQAGDIVNLTHAGHPDVPIPGKFLKVSGSSPA